MKNLLCPMLLAFVGFVAAAKADTISITFDNPTQIAVPGSTLVFTGTITNLSSATVYLNASYYTLSGTNLSVNDQFFNNVPISLAAGANSGDIEIFDVNVANSPVSTSNQSGSYGITGGPDFNAASNLGSGAFAINAPAASAPEIDPSLATSGLILIAGGIAVIRGRRIRQIA